MQYLGLTSEIVYSMKEARHKTYDSIYINFKNQQNYCIVVEIRIVMWGWNGRNSDDKGSRVNFLR